jgi:single-strand DNA-binding protein
MINHITIQGNLTKDPDLRVLPSGTAVLKGSLAHNHKRKDQDGNTTEKVCFLDFTIWGKASEVFAQYFFKGDQALLEGRLELDTWETQAGDKRSKHGMMVERFHFVGKAGES